MGGHYQEDPTSSGYAFHLDDDQVIPMTFRGDSSVRANRIVWTSDHQGMACRSVPGFEQPAQGTRAEHDNQATVPVPDDEQDAMKLQATSAAFEHRARTPDATTRAPKFYP